MTTSTTTSRLEDFRRLADGDGGDGFRSLLFLGGTWGPADSGATLVNREPATGRPLGEVADAGASDLDRAVSRASEAADGWARTPATERGAIAIELGKRVAAAAEWLGMLDARDSGSPVTAMRRDAAKGAASLKLQGGLASEAKGQTMPIASGSLHFTMLQPWGVVARITAFNHPISFACQRLGPALVTGNCVILKPSELTPLSALALAALAEDLVPVGVLSVLTGGPALGAAIARHPVIRRISFTGGVKTALKVSAGAIESGSIKTLTFELGGKNPIILFADADIDAASSAVVRGMNFTRVQGQSCGSTSRLLVHESIHAQVLDRIVDEVARIRIGHPTDEATNMGSLISEQARGRVQGYVDRAMRDGGHLIVGGAAPSDPGLEAGAYFLPTIIDGVAHDSELMQDEVFGPVLAVASWDDVDTAIAMANGVRFGLTASVWTRDLAQAMAAVERLEAGYVWVNDVETRYPAVPFGGWKDSGVGLEHGLDELMSFLRVKSVNVKYGRPA